MSYYEQVYREETGDQPLYRVKSSDYHTLKYVRWLEERLQYKESMTRDAALAKKHAEYYAQKINNLLDNGYIILDESNNIITGRFVFEKGNIYLEEDDMRICYINYIKMLNGRGYSLEDIDYLFKQFKSIAPEDIKNIKELVCLEKKKHR